MFERYTEKARRAIFFARYEATQYGSPSIESEHLLLGILREDPQLTRQLLGGKGTEDNVRRAIESRIQRKERISTVVDVPLTQECHRILKNAAAMADRWKSRMVGPEHLLSALLEEKKSLAVRVLHELGAADLTVNAPIHAGGSPPSSTLRKMLDDVVTAWVRRDLIAFFTFVAEDAHLIDTSGAVHRGKEKTQLLFPPPGSGTDPFATRRIYFEDIRMIRPEVAVANALCDMADPSELGGLEQVRAGLVLCIEAAGWEIVSAQLTEVWPPAK